ncbi:hypothetical protein [Paenibacillus sp. 1P07SE]|uniref:hypothetical protein n=1 Tax=Paenibacillus sp. 1P07SE TaxID=3132209 RepID=UPI0039A56B1C
MKKKWLQWTTVLLVTSMLGTACSNNGNNEPPAAEQPSNNNATNETGEEQPLETIHISMGYNTNRGVVEKPSLWEAYMEERWGLTFDWIEIAADAFEERGNLLFATNEYPEYFFRVNATRSSPLVHNWAREGYLYDYSSDWSKVQNFVDLWTEEEWEEVLRRIQSPDGGVYYIPRIDRKVDGQLPVSLMWNYKKSAWDEMGLEFPETMDELLEALRTIKANDPNAVPIPGRWDITGVTYGLTNAYRTSLEWFIDPDDNDAYNYGPVGDKFREMLTMINTFYTEGLIDREWLTQTDEQWRQDIGSGSAYIQFGNNWYQQFNTLEEGAEWTYAPHYIRAYEGAGMGPLIQTSAGVQLYGPVITDKASDEVRERLLDHINWSFTPEGIDFYNYGIEGETYTIDEDGNRIPTEGIEDTFAGVSGTPLSHYGFGYLTMQEYQPRELAGNGWIEELTQNMHNDPDVAVRMNPSVTLSESDTRDLADSTTMITDTRDRYITYFIMGDRDIRNDAHWQEYLQAMNTAGFERYEQVYKENYERIYLSN